MLLYCCPTTDPAVGFCAHDPRDGCWSNSPCRNDGDCVIANSHCERGYCKIGGAPDLAAPDLAVPDLATPSDFSPAPPDLSPAPADLSPAPADLSSTTSADLGAFGCNSSYWVNTDCPSPQHCCANDSRSGCYTADNNACGLQGTVTDGVRPACTGGGQCVGIAASQIPYCCPTADPAVGVCSMNFGAGCWSNTFCTTDNVCAPSGHCVASYCKHD